jgi:hypothetical protein
MQELAYVGLDVFHWFDWNVAQSYRHEGGLGGSIKNRDQKYLIVPSWSQWRQGPRRSSMADVQGPERLSAGLRSTSKDYLELLAPYNHYNTSFLFCEMGFWEQLIESVETQLVKVM